MESAAEARSRLNTVCLEIIILMWELRIHLRHIGSRVQNVQLCTDACNHIIIIIITHRCGTQSCVRGCRLFSCLSPSEASWITAVRTGQWFVALLQERMRIGCGPTANSLIHLLTCIHAHTPTCTLFSWLDYWNWYLEEGHVLKDHLFLVTLIDNKGTINSAERIRLD